MRMKSSEIFASIIVVRESTKGLGLMNEAPRAVTRLKLGFHGLLPDAEAYNTYVNAFVGVPSADENRLNATSIALTLF